MTGWSISWQCNSTKRKQKRDSRARTRRSRQQIALSFLFVSTRRRFLLGADRRPATSQGPIKMTTTAGGRPSFLFLCFLGLGLFHRVDVRSISSISSTLGRGCLKTNSETRIAPCFATRPPEIYRYLFVVVPQPGPIILR